MRDERKLKEWNGGQFPRGYQFLIVNLAVQITYILINQKGGREIKRV